MENNCGTDDWKLKVFDWFRKFKLANCLYTCQESLSLEIIRDVPNAKPRCKKDLKLKFGDFVVRDDMIEEKVKDGILELRVELFVMRKSDFKAIVEAAISLIPDEEIKRIKQGHPVISETK